MGIDFFHWDREEDMGKFCSPKLEDIFMPYDDGYGDREHASWKDASANHTYDLGDRMTSLVNSKYGDKYPVRSLTKDEARRVMILYTMHDKKAVWWIRKID